jgi:adenylate cyclase
LEQQVPAVLVATADADADIIGQNDHPINLGFARSVQLALSRFEGIRVFAVPTGLSFADTIAKMNSTGRRTGSIYLLETGVKDEGQTTRFWWTLKNAANGEVIWSDLVDQPVAVGVSPSLEDAVAADIARVIGQPLGLVASRESQTTGQTSLTGYTCVLKARAYFVSVSESLHREVRSCLEQTVVSSPDYAEAHALLAWMYLEEDRNGFNLRTTHENALADALLAAQRAAELAPQSATVMEALMAIYYRKGDFDTAFEFGRRAMALNPHNPELAGSLGTRLFARGHWDEGAALVQESLKNSLIAQPLDRITLVLDCYRRAKYKEALDQAQQLGVPDFYGQWVLLAAIYAKLGERDQAKTAVTELLRLRPYYASELRDDMHSRHYTEPMIDMIADGLSAAGLTVQ